MFSDYFESSRETKLNTFYSGKLNRKICKFVLIANISHEQQNALLCIQFTRELEILKVHKLAE